MQSFLHAMRTIFGVFLDALTFMRLCFTLAAIHPRINKGTSWSTKRGQVSFDHPWTPLHICEHAGNR